jgi:integrase
VAIKQAKTFDDAQFDKFLKFIDENSTLPARDRLMAMLSFKAGLRAGEIAKIDLNAMTTVDGKIAPVISIFSNVGKKNRQREIPMHAEVRKALAEFIKAFPKATFVAISSRPFRHAVRYGRPLPTTYERASPDAVTRYLNKLYRKAGFEGASTHSGRRTFGTKAARVANMHHCSLRDVQLLLGHARLETTERYLEPSEDSVDLVNAL